MFSTILVKFCWNSFLEASLWISKFESDILFKNLMAYGLSYSSWLDTFLLEKALEWWVLSKKRLFWEDIEELVSLMIRLDSTKLLNYLLVRWNFSSISSFINSALLILLSEMSGNLISSFSAGNWKSCWCRIYC